MEKTKNLIIYYSRRGENYVAGEIKNLERGNTEIVVDFIRKTVPADVFEIETVKDYPADYLECTRVAKEEQRQHARPALTHYLTDVNAYDNIVIAVPCWWGTAPCCVLTQLEKLDFAGKRIFPVMTHEGTTIRKLTRTLKKTCKGAKAGKGLAIHGAEVMSAEDAVTCWADKWLR